MTKILLTNEAPLRLGVSLLKDKNGSVELDLPVKGDLKDPEFKA